jgi:hypothetical protein
MISFLAAIKARKKLKKKTKKHSSISTPKKFFLIIFQPMICFNLTLLRSSGWPIIDVKKSPNKLCPMLSITNFHYQAPKKEKKKNKPKLLPKTKKDRCVYKK